MFKTMSLSWFSASPVKNLGYIMVFFYFSLLLLLAPTQILSFDSYYYWEWSRHLDLSYFDGPPMIAYWIKFATMLFGDTLLALNIVGICGVAGTAWIIYKTARLFLNPEASCIAMLLWVFAPLNTLDLLKQTTYDVPYILFWALTIYCVANFIQVPKRSAQSITWLYLSGISVGCMMLSKYSGIILVLALFLFMVITPYRYLFRNRHFYLSLGVSLLIFSPVIIWNAAHDWQSFLFQLATHARSATMNPGMAMVRAFFRVILPSLNCMLLPVVLGGRAVIQDRNTRIPYLALIICVTFVAFYLFYAIHNVMVGNWMSPYLISAALLGGYGYQRLHYRKSTIVLIVISAIISVVIATNNSPKISFSIAKGYIYHQLIQRFNTYYPQLPPFIFTTTWSDARMLFFLKDKPPVYTLDNCSTQQNEYAFWSHEFVKKVANKSIKEALYMDRSNHIDCVEKYFDHCIQLAPPTYHFKGQDYAIYAYKCINK